jgi:molybdopterin molybdotransferase
VRELLTIREARARILERVHPLPSEVVSLEDAAGRILAEDAVAVVDLPPFPSSAMDGFAVRAAETPGTLPVAFRVAAGAPPPAPLPVGAAAGIATGGSVPEGADAVVPVELTVERDTQVEVSEAVRPGMHIRPRGGDVQTGMTVVDAGTQLDSVQIGALAAAGVAEVDCGRTPRVAVLATGNELRAPGEVLEPGQIYESNRTMLAASLRTVGAAVELFPVVGDEEDLHREALSRALEADVVVTSGGVSMGPHDLVRRVEAGLGVEEIFWGVAVKPGKPLSFGIRGRTLVFGLPGNPVSSLVGALLFVRPALLALQGAGDPGPNYDVGIAGAQLRRNAHRDEFVRSRRRLEPAGVVLEPVSGQDSHMIVRAASADAVAHVPLGDGEIAAGEPVRYLRLA